MEKIKKWRDAYNLAEKMAGDPDLGINYYDDCTGPEDPDGLIMILFVVGRDFDPVYGRERLEVLIHNDNSGNDRYTKMEMEEVADLFWNNRKFINKYIQEV